jgi:hypothetical protein
MMAMKEKKPGDHIILRLKNTESPLILKWINNQSNLSDSIRYLVEEEIKAHSVRDLQEYIPAKRKPLEVQVETAATEEVPKIQRISEERALAANDRSQPESEQNLQNEANSQVETAKNTEHEAIGHERENQEETSVHHLPEREEQAKETTEELESVKRLEPNEESEPTSETVQELKDQPGSELTSESEGDFRKESRTGQENEPVSKTEPESVEQKEEEDELSDDIIDHCLNI